MFLSIFHYNTLFLHLKHSFIGCFNFGDYVTMYSEDTYIPTFCLMETSALTVDSHAVLRNNSPFPSPMVTLCRARVYHHRQETDVGTIPHLIQISQSPRPLPGGVRDVYLCGFSHLGGSLGVSAPRGLPWGLL